MSTDADKFVDGMVALIYRILRRRDAPVARCYMAYFVQDNAIDSNLADIRKLDGSLVAGLPTLSSVPALTANDPILVLTGPAVPDTVIGKVVGDITAVNVTANTPPGA